MTPALEDTKEAIREYPREGSDQSGATVDTEPKGVRKAAKRTKNKTKGVFRKIARKLAGMGNDVVVVGEERKVREGEDIV